MKHSAGAAARVRGRTLLVLGLLPSVSLPLTVALGLLIAAGTALSLLFIFVMGGLVGSIPMAVGSGFSSPPGRETLVLLFAVAGLFLTQQALAPLTESIAESLGRKLDGALRARVMEAVAAPPGLQHLEDPIRLDLIRAAQGVGVGNIPPGAAVVGVTNNISRYLRILGSVVILATFNPLIAGGVAAAAFLVRSRLLDAGGKRVQVLLGQSRALRRSDYYRDLAVAPLAAKEIRIFDLGRWVKDRFQSHWDSVMQHLWSERKKERRAPIAWFFPIAALVGYAIYVLGGSGARGEIDLARLTVYAQALLAAAGWFVTDSDILVEHGAAAIEPALSLEEHTDDSYLTIVSDPHPVPVFPNRIVFDNVWFRYPGTEKDVLRGLNLEISKGRSLAIVGSNGAGKTTFVKLLARLYDPTKGRILADGVDIRNMSPREWQRKITAIFQDFAKYELTAAENIGLGAVEFLHDAGSIKVAARESGALDLIDQLPFGWETILSREYTQGTDLSGGEWQRIALARCLFALLGGARIMVLDEPTANLDVRAEVEVFKRFLEITTGLPTILISHRFSTVRNADEILVLEGGRLIEHGSHEALMASRGRYHDMFRLQSIRFLDEPGSEESELIELSGDIP